MARNSTAEERWFEIIVNGNGDLRGGPVPERLDDLMTTRELVEALRTLNPGVDISARSVTIKPIYTRN
jgi:hypothetical protein